MTKPISKEYSAPNNATVEIPVVEIRPSALNPRKHFSEIALEELTNSIRLMGVEQAITVRPTGEESTPFEIVMGERRWRAATAAGLETIPASISPCTDEELVSRALTENLVRSDLSCMEIAHGYKALVDQGWLQEKIAAQFSTEQSQVSQSQVSLLLGLLKLPEYVQGLLESQRLSKSHGFALLPLAEEEKACSWLAKCAIDEPLSEKELRDRVRAKRQELDDKKLQPRLPLEGGTGKVTTTTTSTTTTSTPAAPPKPAPEVRENYTPADAKKEFEASQKQDPDITPLSQLPTPPPEATGAAAPVPVVPAPLAPVAPVWTPPTNRTPVTGLLYDDQQEWLVGAGFSLFTGLDRLRQLNVTPDAWVALQMLTHYHNSQPERLGKPSLSTADVLDIVILASAVAKELIPSQALATETAEETVNE